MTRQLIADCILGALAFCGFLFFLGILLMSAKP